MTTTKPSADQIDNYIAREYLARGTSGSLTGQLLMMAEEARTVGKGAAEILENAAREMAGWEIENT
jgi:hypothetical protein